MRGTRGWTEFWMGGGWGWGTGTNGKGEDGVRGRGHNMGVGAGGVRELRQGAEVAMGSLLLEDGEKGRETSAGPGWNPGEFLHCQRTCLANTEWRNVISSERHPEKIPRIAPLLILIARKNEFPKTRYVTLTCKSMQKLCECVRWPFDQEIQSWGEKAEDKNHIFNVNR